MEVELTRVGNDFGPSDSGDESDEHDFGAPRAGGREHVMEENPFPRCVPRPRWTSRLWRSVSMSRARLFVERDQAFNLVTRLGQMDCVQFIDLNRGALFHDRAFSHDIVQSEEVDRKLRALRTLLRQRNVRIPRVVLQLEASDQVDPFGFCVFVL
jgi:hypothetical protein